MPITANGVNYSDDQIRNYFSTSPTRESIAQGAVGLGLNADQISQAMTIAGHNTTAADVTNWGGSNGYNFNGANGIIQRAQATPSPTPAATPAPATPAAPAPAATPAAPAPTANPNNPWDTNIQLRDGVLTQQAIKDFFASNPSNQQILKRASELGMTQDQMRQAINSAGLLFTPDTTGQSTLPQAQRRPNGTSLYNDLVTDLWNGGQGYGLDSYGMAGGNARIVAGTGHNAADMGGGAIQWQEYGTGQNSAGPGNSGYSGGSGGGSSTGSSGGIVSSAMSPNSATVQNWNVTAPQTVNQQAANIIAQDSPLMQQARARALMAANERGLVNSSMAAGDAQSAVLDRAIEIGSRDASTNAQAAQFNANAANQNSMFNVGQSNQWGTNALDRQERALDREQSASERAKDRAAAIAAAGFDAQTRRELAALENTYRTQLNSDQGFDRQFLQYTETLLRIDSDPNLDAEAKTRLKETALNSLRSYATVRNLNLDLNFGTQPTTPLTQTEIAAAAAQRLREIAAAQGLISQSGGFQGAGVGTGADGSASGGVGGLGIGDGGTGGSGD